MPADNLEIINRALILLGEDTMATLAQQGYVGDTVRNLYEPMVVSLFGKHEWRFARTRVALVEDTGGGAPINKWTRAFLLPVLNTDRIGAPHQFFNSASIAAPSTSQYELIGARVESDDAGLWCRYTKRQSETLWPESFARMVAHAFASEIAIPITQQKTMMETYKTLAFGTASEEFRGGMFKEALQEDTWSDPQVSLMEYSDPIADSRFG